MVPTLHRSGAPGVPEFENLPGGIRQPPLGAGRQLDQSLNQSETARRLKVTRQTVSA